MVSQTTLAPARRLCCKRLVGFEVDAPRGATIALRLLLPFAEARRALPPPLKDDVQQILQLAGVSPGQLQSPDARMDWTVAHALLVGSVNTTQREDFGLLAAERAGDGHFGIPEFAARSQRSVGEALILMVRLHPLLHEGTSLTVQRGTVTAELGFALHPALPTHPAVDEFALAAYLTALRRMIDSPDFRPLRVRFPHAQPRDLTSHERIFRCPVEFGQQVSSLTIPSEVLDRPLSRADSLLGSALEAVADRMLEGLDNGARWTDRARRVVANNLASGALDADALAQHLGVSPRTLQRRLSSEGTNVRQVVEQVRYTLALEYLQRPELSIAEVSYLLGYANGSAFQRAFRRWTGQSAGSYRTEIRQRKTAS